MVLVLSAAAEGLDSSTRDALSEAYYEFEVAGYCSLVNDAVAAGFRREVGRILGDADIDRETLDELRGKACRNEGRAAAERFLAEPP